MSYGAYNGCLLRSRGKNEEMSVYKGYLVVVVVVVVVVIVVVVIVVVVFLSFFLSSFISQ